MSRNNPSKRDLSYGRQSLRKATKFVEGDYTGINPRQFYRSLKRSLEEIQQDGDFKYETVGNQETDLSIESEDVGEKTGRVKGRLAASSEPHPVGQGELEYKPYGPHGAGALVVGAIFAFFGLSGELLPILLGLILLIGGGYLYFKKETASFAVEREDVIRALMTGEVSERTIEDDDETRTDIFANMSVIYAGDSLLQVPVSRFDDMPWTLRRTLTTQVKKWYNQLVDEHDRVDIDEGFVSNLSAWANRSADSDRATVQALQGTLNDTFELRVRYTDLLEEQLPRGTRDELGEHQERLLDELEELSEEMDVYVEREGLKRVE
ncbi:MULTISPECIES: hypothetical protein [Halobacterium]|uniref:hypothetical protein n=1 Tax=Halobacterium TaxID=2239 RepID=UPI00073EEDD8|nr:MULTISPECIES: hypothetical protein [Halobacterium]MCG1003581.1 hypothetical protein [Halobacterium noricense]